MADINNAMSAQMNYVQKDGKGKIISKGKTKIDWLGKIHTIQWNYRTGEIIESVWFADGKFDKTKIMIPLRIKILRLVGLKKRDVKL